MPPPGRWMTACPSTTPRWCPPEAWETSIELGGKDLTFFCHPGGSCPPRASFFWSRAAGCGTWWCSSSRTIWSLFRRKHDADVRLDRGWWETDSVFRSSPPRPPRWVSTCGLMRLRRRDCRRQRHGEFSCLPPEGRRAQKSFRDLARRPVENGGGADSDGRANSSSYDEECNRHQSNGSGGFCTTLYIFRHAEGSSE